MRLLQGLDPDSAQQIHSSSALPGQSPPKPVGEPAPGTSLTQPCAQHLHTGNNSNPAPFMHIRWDLGTRVSCQCNNQQVKAIIKGLVVITLAVAVNTHGIKRSCKIRATQKMGVSLSQYMKQKSPLKSQQSHTHAKIS